MNKPERHFCQILLTRGAHRATAAHTYAGSHLMGIGGAVVHRAKSAEAHPHHIHSRSIVGIVLLHPFHGGMHPLGLPTAAGALRSHYHGIHSATFLHSIDQAIALHRVEVVAAQAGTMQKHYERHSTHTVFVVVGQIEPKVICVAAHIAMRSERSLGSRHLGNASHNQRHKHQAQQSSASATTVNHALHHRLLRRKVRDVRRNSAKAEPP